MTDVYYPALIDANDSGFGVTVPGFLGCMASGATMNGATLSSDAALAHVENLLMGDDDLPEPSSLDEINATIGEAGRVACVLIRMNMPVEQVLISLDAGWLRSIDAVTIDRSAWIAQMSRRAGADARCSGWTGGHEPADCPTEN